MIQQQQQQQQRTANDVLNKTKCKREIVDIAVSWRRYGISLDMIKRD